MEVDAILAFAGPNVQSRLATLTDPEKRRALAARLVEQGKIPAPKFSSGPAYEARALYTASRSGRRPPQARGRGN